MSRSTLRRITTEVSIPGEAPLTLAAEVWLPATRAAEPRVWVCLPGGAMNRRYFDLQVEGDDSFSFAAQMLAKGDLVIAIDHPGVGDSDKPADSYALTADVITEANAEVTAQLLAELREGRLSPQLPALPGLHSILVGHSMGAMLAVLQQAHARQHAALVLLGFSTRGLPEFAGAEACELAKDPAKVRAEIVRLARKMFVVDYPVIKATSDAKVIYASGNAEAAGVLALKPAIEKILPASAFLSMVPGNVAPEAAQIDVPVFLGLGQNDMAGPPHQAPAAFKRCPDFTLQVLPATGHNHFVFGTRHQLFTRLQSWSHSVLARLE